MELAPDLDIRRRALWADDDRCWPSCGLFADSADWLRTGATRFRPIRTVLGGGEPASQPVEGAGFSGSPEGPGVWTRRDPGRDHRRHPAPIWPWCPAASPQA